jgi:hypothetical protein
LGKGDLPNKDVIEKKEKDGETNPSKKDGPSNGYSFVPPPPEYPSGRHIPMPHIAHSGPPPPLDASSFANWQSNMKSHISYSYVELRRVTEEDYNPHYPNNLQLRGTMDKQLNASALHIIHFALFEKDKAVVQTLTSAKATWDTLTELFIRNESIQ